MIRRSALALILALCHPAPVAAEGEWRSELTAAGGVGLHDGGLVQLGVEAETEFALPFESRWQFEGSVRLRADAEDDLTPGRVDRGTYAPGSKPVALGDIGSLQLRDFFWTYRGEDYSLRLGKQQIDWGTLDGLKILDTVNPQDFREFILDDFTDSRIGLWSAHVETQLGGWRGEVAWIPDGTVHAIPRSGAWFELTAPRFRFGAPSGTPEPETITESRSHEFDQSAWAARISRQFGAWAVRGVAYSGIDFEPLGRVVGTAESPLLEQYHERRELYGLGADFSLGSVTLRGEYGFQPARMFNTRTANALSAQSLDQHRFAVGADINGPFETLVNVQYLIDHVNDAPATLVRPDTDQVVTVFVRRAFNYNRFVGRLRWYKSLEEDDALLGLSVEFETGANSRLAFHAESFSGTPVGLFGQFRDQDRATIAFNWSF